MSIRSGLTDDLPVNKDSVLKFSRSLLANGAPAWQRYQAVRAVEFYRNFVLSRTEPDLSSVVTKRAQSGLLFFYQCILGKQLGFLNAVRARQSESIPVWFSRDEIGRLLVHFVGVHRLMFLLMVRLRVAAQGVSAAAGQGYLF